MSAFPITANMLPVLQRTGWVKTKAGTGDPRTLSRFLKTVAFHLGTPVSHRFRMVKKICPRKAETGNPNTLSGKYGLTPFPLHCDTSHWPIPCRYVLLACISPGSFPTSTLLLDTSEMNLPSEERALALSSVFLIRNGRNSFYSSILSSSRHFIRFDPGCMEAMSKEGNAAMGLYSYAKQKDRVRRISLDVGDIIAIDNWRILHGRGENSNVAADRILLRVLVR